MAKKHTGGVGRSLRALAFVMFLAAVGTPLLVFSIWSPPEETPRKAAIVDHLSLTYPNPEFTAEATRLFRETGHEVDYFPGEDTTVNFYRTFPAEDYDYVILRVHAATLANPSLAGGIAGDLGLFTSESYRADRQVLEQSRFQLYKSGYVGGEDWYFSIGSEFIKSSMRSRFRGTVTLMGCEGAKYATVLEALIEQGVEVVIGWDEDVTAAHTDAATLRLLEALVVDDLGHELAVDETMQSIGKDPVFGAGGTPHRLGSRARDQVLCPLGSSRRPTAL